MTLSLNLNRTQKAELVTLPQLKDSSSEEEVTVITSNGDSGHQRKTKLKKRVSFHDEPIVFEEADLDEEVKGWIEGCAMDCCTREFVTNFLVAYSSQPLLFKLLKLLPKLDTSQITRNW